MNRPRSKRAYFRFFKGIVVDCFYFLLSLGEGRARGEACAGVILGFLSSRCFV